MKKVGLVHRFGQSPSRKLEAFGKVTAPKGEPLKKVGLVHRFGQSPSRKLGAFGKVTAPKGELLAETMGVAKRFFSFSWRGNEVKGVGG